MKRLIFPVAAEDNRGCKTKSSLTKRNDQRTTNSAGKMSEELISKATKVELIKSMLAQGASYTEIQNRFGMTRGAVAGFIHRNHLKQFADNRNGKQNRQKIREPKPY